VLVSGGIETLKLTFNSPAAAPALPRGQVAQVSAERKSDTDLPGEALHLDFADFEQLCFLGKGGFGEVHRALWSGAEVAVKKLETSSMTRRESRFVQRELQLLQSCRHPNIVSFYGFTTQPFAIIMELGLANLLEFRKTTELSGANPWKCLLDAAAALHYLHGRSVVHRDVKQENCIVCKEPAGANLIQVKVSDFGLARLLANRACQTGDMTPGVGTRGMRAPEVSDGLHLSEYGPAADVFSFGRLVSEVAGDGWARELSDRCTMGDPADRMTTAAILSWLRAAVSREPPAHA